MFVLGLFPLLNLTFGCHDFGSFPRVLVVLHKILSTHSAHSTKKCASNVRQKLFLMVWNYTLGNYGFLRLPEVLLSSVGIGLN